MSLSAPRVFKATDGPPTGFTPEYYICERKHIKRRPGKAVFLGAEFIVFWLLIGISDCMHYSNEKHPSFRSTISRLIGQRGRREKGHQILLPGALASGTSLIDRDPGPAA
ncbi:hypothetical protein GGR55DRAFT_681736 [Xylaria sp. FL0064]|nr:hypothetical protein GGR55DRAFT_681736 [Xylaria sp. FL0064]